MWWTDTDMLSISCWWIDILMIGAKCLHHTGAGKPSCQSASGGHASSRAPRVHSDLSASCLLRISVGTSHWCCCCSTSCCYPCCCTPATSSSRPTTSGHSNASNPNGCFHGDHWTIQPNVHGQKSTPTLHHLCASCCGTYHKLRWNPLLIFTLFFLTKWYSWKVFNYVYRMIIFIQGLNTYIALRILKWAGWNNHALIVLAQIRSK